MFTTMMALALVATSFAVALAALLSMTLFDRRARGGLGDLAGAEEGAIIFLFEDENLLDASEDARRMLAAAPRTGSDWARLAVLLQPGFPGLGGWIADLAELGRMSLSSEDGRSRIDAEWHDGIARIALVDEEAASSDTPLDRHSLIAMGQELDTLRANADHAPFLSWRESSAGEITWANRAYLDLAEAMNPDAPVQPWPPASLFDPIELMGKEAPENPHRTALPMPGAGDRRWFDLYRTPLEAGTLYTAIGVDDLVRAETALSEFITTLTKTFAHLPIGLAIFDRARQLALFNPALTDLTLLPADFLCARPGLFAFLDKLREKRMMPEPKDYRSWRQQMAELEANAINGTYEETWALPTGQTYRVSGRPQPDGAVAFLFEDISAEISMARRYRTELDLGQAVLDSFSDAFAVFSATGVLVISNRAYAELWGADPSSGFAHMTISDATHGWHQKCHPTPAWRGLRAFVRSEGERSEWQAGVSLKDGRTLECHAVALPQGSTLVAFRPASISEADAAERPGFDPAFASVRA